MIIKDLILNKLQEKFPNEKFDLTEYKGELTFSFDKKNIVEVCRLLKEDEELKFLHCADVTAIDINQKALHYAMEKGLKHVYKATVERMNAELTVIDSRLEEQIKTGELYYESINKHLKMQAPVKIKLPAEKI